MFEATLRPALHVLSSVAFAAASFAAAAPLPSDGLFSSVRAEVTATGRACDYGSSLDPPFVLQVSRSNTSSPSDAVLRDASGIAMRLVHVDGSDRYHLVVIGAPPDEKPLGNLDVLRDTSGLSVRVDYRHVDGDCRVGGAIAFELTNDHRLQSQLDNVVRALDAAERRDVLGRQGKVSEAIEQATVAVALSSAAFGAGHWKPMSDEARLASLYAEADELRGARDRYTALIARMTETLGPDHRHTLRARQNLALILWDMGELDGAERYLRSVSERYETVLDPDDDAALVTRSNLAGLLEQRGSIVEAERILLDVAARFERLLGAEHRRTLSVLNNLAYVYVSAGRDEEALVRFTTISRSLASTLGPNHVQTLRIEQNRYHLMARMGRRAEAIAGMRVVAAGRREAFGAQHAESLQGQQLLAKLIAEEGNAQEAAELLREVVRLRAAGDGASSTDALLAQALLGQLEMRLGDVSGGLARIRAAHMRGLQVLRPGDRAALELAALMGAAERDAGDLEASRTTLGALVGNIEHWREQAALSPTSRRELFAQWASPYKSLAAVELALGNTYAAFMQSERSKARVLVETLALRRGEIQGVLPAEVVSKLAAYDGELAEIESQIARAPHESSARVPLEQRRAGIVAAASALRESTRKSNAKYAALTRASLIGVDEGARELPRGAVFVSYLRDGENLLAFVVDDRGRVSGRDLGIFKDLDETVHAYRTLLAAGNPAATTPVWRLPDGRYRVALGAQAGAVRVVDADTIGRELAKRLIAPIPELSRKRRWIVSPDGALALLPFEVLPYRGRALVATHEIRYAPSFTVHALTARRGRDYQSLLRRDPLYAMGAAYYDGGSGSPAPAGLRNRPLPEIEAALAVDPAGARRAFEVVAPRWTDLPESSRELEAVAEQFAGDGRVTIRRYGDATEEKLREDNRSGLLENQRYVLLSAHGFLSTEAPSLSAIVLGQRNVTPEVDGYVTAAEWTGYTLRSDLIVVSACETGVGKVIEGEGVAGLPYALFVAGNRNALLTLWPVVDRSTSLFVSRFFRHLRSGMSQAAALTVTKREFATRGPYKAPVHWAPFVLWGA